LNNAPALSVQDSNDGRKVLPQEKAGTVSVSKCPLRKKKTFEFLANGKRHFQLNVMTTLNLF
jgi:hypothetical protein